MSFQNSQIQTIYRYIESSRNLLKMTENNRSYRKFISPGNKLFYAACNAWGYLELFPPILSAISVHTGPAVVWYLGIHTQKTDLFHPYPRLRYQLYGEFHPPPPLTASLQAKSGPLRAVFSLTCAGNSSLFHACSYCIGTQMYQSENKRPVTLRVSDQYMPN